MDLRCMVPAKWSEGFRAGIVLAAIHSRKQTPFQASSIKLQLTISLRASSWTRIPQSPNPKHSSSTSCKQNPSPLFLIIFIVVLLNPCHLLVHNQTPYLRPHPCPCPSPSPLVSLQEPDAFSFANKRRRTAPNPNPLLLPILLLLLLNPATGATRQGVYCASYLHVLSINLNPLRRFQDKRGKREEPPPPSPPPDPLCCCICAPFTFSSSSSSSSSPSSATHSTSLTRRFRVRKVSNYLAEQKPQPFEEDASRNASNEGFPPASLVRNTGTEPPLLSAPLARPLLQILWCFCHGKDGSRHRVLSPPVGRRQLLFPDSLCR